MRGYATEKHDKAPFIWDMARACLELPYGAIKHFPAGSYYEQTASVVGRAELRLMNVAQYAWYAFGHMSISDWGKGESRFAKWLMPSKPPPEPPTKHLDRMIQALWPVSPWWAWLAHHTEREPELRISDWCLTR